MNNSCPSCGVVYSVALKDIGRRISCKKCFAALEVTPNGLELDPSEAEDNPDVMRESHNSNDDTIQTTKPPIFATSDGQMEMPKNLLQRFTAIADIPTYLFGAGCFFFLVFMFFPVIDQSEIARRKAKIQLGELRLSEAMRDAKAQSNTQELETNWAKEKKWLDDDVRWAIAGAERAKYWNYHGMLLGCLLLAFGCLGFLQNNQPSIRKIVGAIVLCSLLVFGIMGLLFFGGIFSSWK